MQKELLAPRYAQEFMCTGPKFPDDCCHGWTVSIDPATLQIYTTHPDISRLVQPFLKNNSDLATKDSAPASLKMKPENEQCELQDTSGLCTIQKQFGAEALSSTCALYPRIYHSLGDDNLVIMNESCPEVARCLAEDPDALALDLAPVETWDRLILKNQTEFNSDYQRRYQLLQGLLTLFRYQKISLEMRMFVATLLIQRAEKLLEEGDSSEVSMNDLLALFSDLINEQYFDKQVLMLKESEVGGLPLVILQNLLGMPQKAGRFQEEISKIKTGLGIKETADINSNTLKKLEQARRDYLCSLEKSHPWLLENLLVNWLLTSLFPINKKRISDGWLDLTTRYLLIRTLLAGLGAHQQQLTIDDATRLIYLFARNVNSNPIKLQNLQLALVGKNLNQPAALVHALDL